MVSLAICLSTDKYEQEYRLHFPRSRKLPAVGVAERRQATTARSDDNITTFRLSAVGPGGSKQS